MEPFEYGTVEAVRCHGCGRFFQMSEKDLTLMDYKSHFCPRCQEFHFYATTEEQAKP